MIGSLWSELDNWKLIAEQLDARVARQGEPGHRGWCVANDPETDDVRERLRCTRWAPAVNTVVAATMRSHIDDLVDDNSGNPLSRRCLLLEGPSFAGKTTSTMMVVLVITRAAWRAAGEILPGGYRNIPWVYVEVGENWGYRSIAQQIHRFIGLPFPRDANAETLMDTLRDMLPRLGTVGLIIDDAHNLRSRPDGRSIDGYKTLLTGLPVSIVFIGLEPLTESALLIGAEQGLGSSVQQIARRSTRVNVADGVSPLRRRREWEALLERLVEQMHVPEGEWDSVRGQASLISSLYQATEGLTGTTYEVVRAAAVDAIRKRRPLHSALADQCRALLVRRDQGAVGGPRRAVRRVGPPGVPARG